MRTTGHGEKTSTNIEAVYVIAYMLKVGRVLTAWAHLVTFIHKAELSIFISRFALPFEQRIS